MLIGRGGARLSLLLHPKILERVSHVPREYFDVGESIGSFGALYEGKVDSSSLTARVCTKLLEIDFTDGDDCTVEADVMLLDI